MNTKQWCIGAAALAASIAVAASGCSDDITNNYGSNLGGGDSGVDVIGALSTLGCESGKKECVNDRVARVCPQDGKAWLAYSCRAGEKCDNGDCIPIAGGQTAACVPGDGACLGGNKALRCKADGTGYEQLDCPAGTTCYDRGLCRGAQVVGSSFCNGDRRSLLSYDDGFHGTTVTCAAGEYCVSVGTVPYNVAACKPAQCKPAIGGVSVCGEQALCGDPSNAANDQTKYIASCTETTDGWKWIGSPCAPGLTCNPQGTQCSTSSTVGGKNQAACTGSACTPNTQRCSPDGTGIQTCGTDGKWGAVASPCNAAGGERCFVLPGTSGTLARAVCGDPVCAFAGDGYCDPTTGNIRRCDANGKLKAPEACETGRCTSTSVGTGLPAPMDVTGRCIAECTPNQESCWQSSGSLDGSYRVCTAASRWSAPIACPSPDGAVAICVQYTDVQTNLTKHACVTSADCTPNQRRCVAADGDSGVDAIQICGQDAKWGAPITCSVGYCSTNTGTAVCVTDCVPGQPVCDPVGSGKFLTCPSSGRLPSVPTYDQTCAAAGTTCKRAGGRSYGCIQCVGPNLTDSTVALAEARCLQEDGGAGGSTSLQGCKADNTWDTAVQCSSSTFSCVQTYDNAPSAEPGGVSRAYCN